MKVFRLTKLQFANDLSGKGAEIFGGRWNSIGTALLYTAESGALCTLETRVHFTRQTVPDGYELLTIELPEFFTFREIDPATLPANWKELAEDPSLQTIGDTFIREDRFHVLKVPSAVQPDEFNYLVNPKYRDALRVSSKPFVFDRRLFN